MQQHVSSSQGWSQYSDTQSSRANCLCRGVSGINISFRSQIKSLPLDQGSMVSTPHPDRLSPHHPENLIALCRALIQTKSEPLVIGRIIPALFVQHLRVKHRVGTGLNQARSGSQTQAGRPAGQCKLVCSTVAWSVNKYVYVSSSMKMQFYYVVFSDPIGRSNREVMKLAAMREQNVCVSASSGACVFVSVQPVFPPTSCNSWTLGIVNSLIKQQSVAQNSTGRSNILCWW